jgi:PmbA protein
MTLQETAAAAIDWLRGQTKGTIDAELYFSRGEERGIERRDGKLDGIQQSAADGVGLRLLSGGRMGFACAGGATLETVKRLYGQVSAQLGHLEADPLKAFAEPAPEFKDAALTASLWDDSLFTESWDSITAKLEKMEKDVVKADKRIGSVLRAGYGESRGEVVIANTKGLVTWERGASCSVGVSAMCDNEGDLQVGSAYHSARQKDALEWDRVAKEAAQRTVVLLGAVKEPSGKRSVIFDPWIAGEFLDLVAGLLCADQVQRGKSLLAGKLGQRVGSPLVTFVDDPHLKGGLSSSLYDDEGLPTQRKTMIDRGVVSEYFYDTYTANRDRRRSNASAGRGSYKGLPGPGGSNFYMAPGTHKRDDLLKDTKDGILVLDVMGMHMADPISGEFSVGVSGLSIKNGKITQPVKAAMISGNLLELLDRIDAVADDLTFYGGMGAPTFRVSQMTVA